MTTIINGLDAKEGKVYQFQGNIVLDGIFLTIKKIKTTTSSEFHTYDTWKVLTSSGVVDYHFWADENLELLSE